MPKAQAIDDAMIVQWLGNLDGYCNDPKSAPNLFKLGRKTSKMAYKNRHEYASHAFATRLMFG